MKKRYVLIGASGRTTGMFAEPIMKTFSDCAEIVGIFDPNPLRMEAVKKMINFDCPSYTDCDKMLAELKPDAGLITTVDRTHHEYIIKCLEAGIDAVTEKPMTTDAEKCHAILDAEKRTGRKVTVTFNYRFPPFTTAIKQAIRDGAVGDVLNVDFEYILDTRHGADYFRRWHRKKENSGGLLVHKSTHHFDLINWWIEEEPVEVMAFGTLRFYGPTREKRGDRCLTCQHKGTCDFYYDITSDELARKLYLECESADDYHRDRCPFADEIDMEDTMSVNVRYSKGALLSYSLIAHSPYEGFKVAISGTNGRLEAAEFHSGHRATDSSFYFDVYDRNGQKIAHSVPKSSGGHGGGDERLQAMIFRGYDSDPLGHMASSFDGANSVMIGVAANASMKTGRNVKINDLVPLEQYRK